VTLVAVVFIAVPPDPQLGQDIDRQPAQDALKATRKQSRCRKTFLVMADLFWAGMAARAEQRISAPC
jgi:hypothetical protein